MVERPIIACKRCKAKKLKCDDDPSVSNERSESDAFAIAEEPKDRPPEGGDGGSVTRMAKLVAAAVTIKASDTCLIDVGLEVAQEQLEAERLEAAPARLPPISVGRQLIASYLVQDLEDIYAEVDGRKSSQLFRVFMVFAIGAISLNRQSLHDTSPINYYASALENTGHMVGLSNIQHVQAILLIMLFSLQHDIGIGNPMGYQMQRRVFWACYISDRHSSSVLGRPMAIQDEDIGLPTDADDDLVETRQIETQVFRGSSEVSIQLRHIRLRQITSRISTCLLRPPLDESSDEAQVTIEQILTDLDNWQQSFPLVQEARNTYETTQWRDLNYHRERLKCFRFLVLSRKRGQRFGDDLVMQHCLEAAAHVPMLYQEILASEKLILNWTCVHDIMSAGFTMLYCGLGYREAMRRWPHVSNDTWNQHWSLIRRSTSSAIGILAHIADKWASVERHVRVFKALAGRVADLIQVTQLNPTESAQEAADPCPPLIGGEINPLAMDETWFSGISYPSNVPDIGEMDWNDIDWDAVLAGDAPDWPSIDDTIVNDPDLIGLGSNPQPE
ncbi:hypothetical protein G7Z17_g5208 [Cylindrodendrum hubeiense]|uniref:Xylanolytic transcriptional activator regulatory domain-containing protein n=1 Tax=Cylindrodendrum hubeiense TaxID=595255 RepID=A0A9P5LGD8_9HYPO|nr:hypothetical protein G7Z17_g5208 [Cylindrodendrum hubeiense]